jgi:Zn-dependent peptidase ImmA (M78 family)
LTPIGGADPKSAQMFTVAHELAHLWLGQTGLSDSTVASHDQNAIETWCNRAAAETLAPIRLVRESLLQNEELAVTAQQPRWGNDMKVQFERQALYDEVWSTPLSK